MTTQEWRIPLREAQHEQYGLVVTHGRKPDPKSPSGKRYWYSIDGKSGLHDLPKNELPLYGYDRLPDAKEPVVITEGEKDADALLDRGVVAVGTVTGANGTPCDESLKAVQGRRVYLWADHDPVGYEHMNRIAARLLKLDVDDVRFVKPTYKLNKGDGAADFTGDNTELQKLLEAATPVEKPDGNLPELLDAVCKFINKFVVLTSKQTDALALWVFHTWTFDAADTTPYISISSPEKQSGKTRLLETLKQLVRQPWLTGAASEAALFRKIEQDKPTLLFDEVDATFKGNKELENSIRGILNNGSHRDGVASRVSGQGNNMEVRDYSVFCPKAFAGIGKTLPDTVTDRSIPIELNRKTNSEPVSKFRYRRVVREAEPLRERIEVWAEYNMDSVEQAIEAEPEMPDSLSDRAADGWEPLVAIADLANSGWSRRARASAMALTNDEEDDGTIVNQLLKDILTVFQKVGVDRISSHDLIEGLTGMDEAPWGDHNGKQITPYQLSKWLKVHRIKSRTIRFGDQTIKGYRREDFISAWSAYTPSFNVTPSHSDSELESVDSGLLVTANVTDIKPPEMPQFDLDVTDVTAERGFTTEKADTGVI